jgi:hypothetical protein
VVKVSITVPAVISANVGLYVAFSMAELSNIPVPELVHVEVEALPPIVPASV